MGREGRGDLMRRPPSVARVLERVTRTARDHEMFGPGDRVLLGVSGGPDSVCLLYSLWHLRRLFKIELEVFHFDHRLRPDSAKDGDYVRRLADRLGLAFHLRAAEGAPGKGDSVESWARGRRNVAALDLAEELEAARIATGHTQDDQAETVLAWALMGDLRAIAPRVDRWVRPLIQVPRSEVDDFCGALRLRPRIDSTNRDPKILRNALRLKAIPAIERATRRSVREPLARTGELINEQQGELTHQMYELWPSVFEETEDGARLRAESLVSAPRVIALRLVRQAIFRCGHPSTHADAEAVLDLARGRPGRKRDLPSGLKARREREYVSVSRSSPESRV